MQACRHAGMQACIPTYLPTYLASYLPNIRTLHTSYIHHTYIYGRTYVRIIAYIYIIYVYIYICHEGASCQFTLVIHFAIGPFMFESRGPLS